MATRTIPPTGRGRAAQIAAVFAATCLLAVGAAADIVEDCIGADDPWRRVAACTEAIEGGRYPGAEAAWAYSNRAAARAALGQYLLAFDDHDAAIRLDPASPQAFNNRANSHADFREYDRALADYARALALSPNYRSALWNRAGVLMEMGRPAEAREDYARLVSLDAESPARLNLAEAACKAGDAAAAREGYARSLERGLADRQALALLLAEKGYLGQGDGDLDDALAAWVSRRCP